MSEQASDSTIEKIRTSEGVEWRLRPEKKKSSGVKWFRRMWLLLFNFGLASYCLFQAIVHGQSMSLLFLLLAANPFFLLVGAGYTTREQILTLNATSLVLTGSPYFKKKTRKFLLSQTKPRIVINHLDSYGAVESLSTQQSDQRAVLEYGLDRSSIGFMLSNQDLLWLARDVSDELAKRQYAKGIENFLVKKTARFPLPAMNWLRGNLELFVIGVISLFSIGIAWCFFVVFDKDVQITSSFRTREGGVYAFAILLLVMFLMMTMYQKERQRIAKRKIYSSIQLENESLLLCGVNDLHTKTIPIQDIVWIHGELRLLAIATANETFRVEFMMWNGASLAGELRVALGIF